MLTDPFGLDPAHDAYICFVRIHTPVAKIHKGRGGHDSDLLHQDDGLLQLGLEGVAVTGVAIKRFSPHDEAALECAGNAQFVTELVRCAGFALAYAVHLEGVPAVELGLSAHRLASSALALDAFGFV